MGRAPNKRDASTTPGPRTPTGSSAGKDLVRNPQQSRKMAQAEPCDMVMDKVIGMGAARLQVHRPAALEAQVLARAGASDCCARDAPDWRRVLCTCEGRE